MHWEHATSVLGVAIRKKERKRALRGNERVIFSIYVTALRRHDGGQCLFFVLSLCAKFEKEISLKSDIDEEESKRKFNILKEGKKREGRPDPETVARWLHCIVSRSNLAAKTRISVPEMERKSTKRPICGGKARLTADDTAQRGRESLEEIRGSVGTPSSDSAWIHQISGAVSKPVVEGKKPFSVPPPLLWFPPGLQLRADTPNPKRGPSIFPLRRPLLPSCPSPPEATPMLDVGQNFEESKVRKLVR